MILTSIITYVTRYIFRISIITSTLISTFLALCILKLWDFRTIICTLLSLTIYVILICYITLIYTVFIIITICIILTSIIANICIIFRISIITIALTNTFLFLTIIIVLNTLTTLYTLLSLSINMIWIGIITFWITIQILSFIVILTLNITNISNFWLSIITITLRNTLWFLCINIIWNIITISYTFFSLSIYNILIWIYTIICAIFILSRSVKHTSITTCFIILILWFSIFTRTLLYTFINLSILIILNFNTIICTLFSCSTYMIWIISNTIINTIFSIIFSIIHAWIITNICIIIWLGKLISTYTNTLISLTIIHTWNRWTILDALSSSIINMIWICFITTWIALS